MTFFLLDLRRAGGFPGRIGMRKNHSVLVSVLVLFALVLLMSERSHADPLRELQKNLPNRIQAWTTEGADRLYDRITIFDYINGAAETYLSYNMENCLSRRFTSKNGPAIVLDIFDMGSSEEAFGIFTHDQDGEPLPVGQEALYRPGWLSFWKDRFFVSIYAEEEREDVEKAVRELGKRVASLIKNPGKKPGILDLLPKEGLKPKTIRYFHDHELFNFHFYLSDENILNLDAETKAALAEYRIGKEEALLLLVTYPDRTLGERAQASVREHYLPDADDRGMVRLENGKWSALSSKGNLLALVLESDSPGLAENLLKKVMDLNE